VEALAPYNVKDISGGFYNKHTCFRKADTSTYCFGRELYGELGDGGEESSTQATPVRAVGPEQ
jgi:hypothetical protein